MAGEKVGILGAGMMGAGIAYAAAIKGIAVILKDVAIENAEKAKPTARNCWIKKLLKGG